MHHSQFLAAWLALTLTHIAAFDPTLSIADEPSDVLRVEMPKPGAGTPLELIEKEVFSKSFAVTGSGAVWTIAPKGPPRFHKGKRVPATKKLLLGYDDDLESIYEPAAPNEITFFDNGKWHSVAWTERLNRRDRNGPSGQIVPGKDNTVFVVGDQKALLVQGTNVIDDGDVLELIRKHQKTVRKSFEADAPHPILRDNWQNLTMICADHEGHIWCLHDFTLKVLVDNEWLDCRDSILKAGGNGDVTFFVPGPGGRFLYFGDGRLLHDRGMSFFAKVENGQISLTRTHHFVEGSNHSPAVREGDEAMWIARRDGRAVPQSDLITGQSAIRMDENGEQTHLMKTVGYPAFWDPNGYIWLGLIRGGPPGRFNIVREGEIVQRIQIPSVNEQFNPSVETMALFCDRPGSVYVQSSLGLQHMIADKTKGNHYAAGNCYTLGEADEVIRGYSTQGYCISVRARFDDPLKFLYLIKLPKNKLPVN